MGRVPVDDATAAALVAAEQVLECRAEWELASDVQARFLTDVFVICRDETVSEIESLASWSADELNAFSGAARFLRST